MHSIRIEDALYEKVSNYCKENNIRINVFCSDAIRQYLTDEMYGDAPFMSKSDVKTGETDIYDNTSSIEVVEKAGEEINKSVLEKVQPREIDTNIGVSTPQKDFKTVTEILSTNTAGEFKRPSKRRL